MKRARGVEDFGTEVEPPPGNWKSTVFKSGAVETADRIDNIVRWFSELEGNALVRDAPFFDLIISRFRTTENKVCDQIFRLKDRSNYCSSFVSSIHMGDVKNAFWNLDEIAAKSEEDISRATELDARTIPLLQLVDVLATYIDNSDALSTAATNCDEFLTEVMVETS